MGNSRDHSGPAQPQALEEKVYLYAFNEYIARHQEVSEWPGQFYVLR